MTDQPAPAYAYAPGEWTVLVRGRLLAALPAGTAPATVGAVWDAMDDDAGIGTLLPLVSGGFGAGLAAMPPFAVASTAQGLHVILRGHVTLTVAGPTGSTTYTGERVTTWTEHLLDGGSSFTLTCGPLDGVEPSLPLVGGVVLAGSITATPAGTGAGTAADTGAKAQLAAGAEAQPAAAADARRARTGTPTTESSIESSPAPSTVSSATPSPASPAAHGRETGGGVVPVAEPGSLGAMDPELEAEPSTAVGQQAGGQPAGDAGPAAGAPDADDSATINPNLYLTSVPSDVADPSVVSAAEPLVPVTAPPAAGPAEDDAGPDGGPGTAAPAGTADQAVEAVEAVEDDGTSGPGYDHLWDQTIARRVEDAAVREDDDAPTLGPTPATEPASPPVTEPAASDTDAAVPGASAAAQAPATGPVPAPEPVTPPTFLIDSVPWAKPAPAPPAPAPAPSAPAPAPPAPEPAPNLPPAPADPLGDHDGQTIMRSQLPGAAGDTGAGDGPEAPAGADRVTGTGPLVLARLCVAGHANAPTSSACSVCGGRLQAETRQVHRPTLGVMRISTGEVVDLDRSVVVGRQPSVSRVQGREMPRLVQVQSASGDISRSHVEVRLDGWHVLLCDLKATNGTVLIREGQPPRRLGQGETAFLLDGDIAQLGDDVSLRFEDLP
ncbi:FHA domain-containing protein [Arthrobacter sp. Soc17.1.1.1]|uniref:FHA domain-containing protein n=1 Tax=Arthrobacter sp. Soc17.1.1.1 TaxID=3121277 RepID=UPI002FE4B7E6